MYSYLYNRTLENNNWNINNTKDVDANGNSVPLAFRINADATIGNKLDSVVLNENNATVKMISELSPEEKTILDNIVLTHINANGIINYTTYNIYIADDGKIYNTYVDNNGNILSK